MKEGYIVVCMAAYLGLVHPAKSNGSGEVVGYIFAWFIFVYGVILLPAISMVVIKFPKTKLEGVVYSKRIGVLYEDMNLETAFLRSSLVLHFLRRLWVVLIIVRFR